MRKRQHILFLSNQSTNTDTKIYSLTQCSLTVNECNWHILADNDERSKSHLGFYETAKGGIIVIFVLLK